MENINRNGIYKIPFTSENGEKGVYVGMTQRKFIRRKKEHQADIRLFRVKTALGKKNVKENIVVDFDNAKIVAPPISKRVALRETIEILA